MNARNVIAALCLILARSAPAAEYKGTAYTVEPILGYEFQKKDNPSRTTGVFVFGARATAGWKIVSLEAEYTRGQSAEVVNPPPVGIEEETQRFRAGLRSTYSFGPSFEAYVRAGGELQRTRTRRIISGLVITDTESDSRIYPYAGLGTSVRLRDWVAATLGVTATFKDFSDFSRVEFATTFGAQIRFGSK